MLRTFFKADIPQVLAIENLGQIAPWTEETFKMCFQTGFTGWVMEDEKKITGFIIASLTAEECHILNLCVHRDFQHQGLGTSMLLHALAQAKQIGAGIAYLEVRRSNSRAIALYRKMKFHLIGERKNYYPTLAGQEDALIFAKSLTQPD